MNGSQAIERSLRDLELDETLAATFPVQRPAVVDTVHAPWTVNPSDEFARPTEDRLIMRPHFRFRMPPSTA